MWPDRIQILVPLSPQSDDYRYVAQPCRRETLISVNYVYLSVKWLVNDYCLVIFLDRSLSLLLSLLPYVPNLVSKEGSLFSDTQVLIKFLSS